MGTSLMLCLHTCVVLCQETEISLTEPSGSILTATTLEIILSVGHQDLLRWHVSPTHELCGVIFFIPSRQHQVIIVTSIALIELLIYICVHCVQNSLWASPQAPLVPPTKQEHGSHFSAKQVVGQVFTVTNGRSTVTQLACKSLNLDLAQRLLSE